MKKILIFYGSYGGGHLSAAKSVKAYIEENYPETEVRLTDCIECASKFRNKVSASIYKFLVMKAPWAWKIVYTNSENGILYKISKLSNNNMSKKLYKYIKAYGPDLIICTHFFAAQMCTILKQKNLLNMPLYTIMTDFHIHNQWLINSEYMDCFFVSNQEMKDQMCAAGLSESKVIIAGIPFSDRFLRAYNRNEVLKQFGLKDGKMTALFFAGGELGLGKKRTFDIFETLVESFPDIQVVAVAGKNEESKKRFEECVKKFHREGSVCVLGYTTQVPELMSISDFVITKPGGLTTTESLVSGLPMIVTNPIPGHEIQNAEFIEENHIGVWLRETDDIKSVVEKFVSSKEELKVMSENAHKFSRPNSLKDICSKLNL